jgi:hypothetical protein
MANRIYYACQSVQINGPSGTLSGKNPAYDTIQGLQSVGMNTNFNLEPVYQMGQIQLYDNYEEIPEVEITLSKVLDGYPTIYSMAMGTGTLANLANNRCGVRMQLFPDTQTVATGTPLASVECAPAYVSSVSYKFPTEGNFTEDVTLVSNDKYWATGTLSNTDAVLVTESPNPDVGILRRGLWSKNSVLPNSGIGSTISGIYSSNSGGIPSGSKINNVTVSMNLGREQIRELGSRTPYYRYIKFPVEITTEIEVTAIGGDMVGVYGSSNATCSNPKALTNKQIIIRLCDGTTLDLGSKNKLTSVNFTGGDTGGSNATITYSYTTYSEFTYTGPTGTTGYQSPGSGLAYNDPSGVVESGLPVAGVDY